MRKNKKISVLVPTMNSGEYINATIDSILSNTHSDIELIILDQSKENAEKSAIERLCSDSRVTYIHLDRPGKTHALNIGLERAQGEIVLLTDDDCVPQPDWAVTLEKTFEDFPKTGAIFCSVLAAPHDTTQGIIQHYTYLQTRELTTMSHLIGGILLEAGMAVRRSAVRAVGGFDEMLGVGACFPACEGSDLCARLMLAGYTVVQTDRTAVTHFGFYTHEKARSVSRKYWYGIGAAAGKWMRYAGRRYSTYPLQLAAHYFLKEPVLRLLRGERHTGLSNVSFYVRGVREGNRVGADRKTGCFRLLSSPTAEVAYNSLASQPNSALNN